MLYCSVECQTLHKHEHEYVCHQHPSFSTMYDDSREAGLASTGNRIHRYWSALMAQYKQTGSLAPPAVAVPIASVPTAPAPTAFVPIIPVPIAFAPTPPEGSAPQMTTSFVAEALVAQKEVAQAQLVIENDRVRALTADLVRLQGQLANARPAAATQGASFQAPLNSDDHEVKQDQEHITPGNPDDAEPTDAEPTAEDDDAIISA